jgi:glycosyltransferase involved in cell wall biosynthesis
MKVLMLGWELPPHNSGGLGEACLGISKSLSNKGVELTFVLPNKVDLPYNFMKIVFANVKNSKLSVHHPYISYNELIEKHKLKGFTPSDFVSGSFKFAEWMDEVVSELGADFDIIHCHDWFTFPAGVVAKEKLNKPLIAQIHSTEFDRTGGNNPNENVFQIEKMGLDRADKIISVSNLQKSIIFEKYGIEKDKIEVIYNGIDEKPAPDLNESLIPLKKMGYKIVLFLGRITLQKGPEYFIQAAQKVLKYEPKTIFVVVGSGDMQEKMMTEAVNLGVMKNMIFTGFLRGSEKDKIWVSSDVYVMPSVSEPFGLSALEAVANGTPVIISKQSGVSELVVNALKVDFWDTDEIANKIVSVLKYPPLTEDLRAESKRELPSFSWDNSAEKFISLYKSLV